MDIIQSDIPYTPKHQTEVQAIQELSHFHPGHTHRWLLQAKVTDKNRDLYKSRLLEHSTVKQKLPVSKFLHMI